MKEEKAPQEARYLLERSRQEQPLNASNAIMELVTTIISYKFKQLNRAEVETMLDITLQETGVYKDIKQEGRLEEAANLVIRQLTKRIGQELSEEMRARIPNMPLPVLENLSEALLDFTSLADLEAWLEVQ